MNDYIVSMIRTWVPVGVGAFLTWLSTALEITDIDTATAATVATGIVISVYYGLVRIAEKRWPQIGILLGKKQAPHYVVSGSTDA